MNTSDAAKPNLPVRSAWSAIRPATSTAATAADVGFHLTFEVAQAGRGAAATGSHAVPSQRHRPSGDS